MAKSGGLASVFRADRRGAAGEGCMGRRTIWMPFARPGPAAAVALVAVLLGAGALAGCDSEATPPATSSPSVTSTGTGTGGPPSPSVTSPSPSVSASVEVPAAAREKTEKGAEAFVRFFCRRRSTRAWTSPDPGLIDGLSAMQTASPARTSRARRTEFARQATDYAAAPITVTRREVLPGDRAKSERCRGPSVQHAGRTLLMRRVLLSARTRQSNLERTLLLYWQEGQMGRSEGIA